MTKNARPIIVYVLLGDFMDRRMFLKKLTISRKPKLNKTITSGKIKKRYLALPASLGAISTEAEKAEMARKINPYFCLLNNEINPTKTSWEKITIAKGSVVIRYVR